LSNVGSFAIFLGVSMSKPVPRQHELVELLEEVNDAMPLTNEVPHSEADFMVRMIKAWWNGPFSHKTIAPEDVAELKRLHEKYCGEPKLPTL
jgi:hypothetical protein